MSLSNLISKRNTYLSAVSNYRDAVNNETNVSSAKDQAILSGKEYTDEIQTSRNLVTNEDELFSDSVKMGRQRRNVIKRLWGLFLGWTQAIASRLDVLIGGGDIVIGDIDDNYLYASKSGSILNYILYIYQRSDWEMVNDQITFPGQIHDIKCDGSLLYVLHDGGNGLTVFNRSNMSVISNTPTLPENAIEMSISNRFICIAFNSTEVYRVYDKHTFSLLSFPTIPNVNSTISLSSTDDVLAIIVVTTQRVVLTIDLNSAQLIAITGVGSHDRGVLLDDQYMYIYRSFSGNGTFRVRNISGENAIFTYSLPGNGRGLYFDDEYVYVSHSNESQITIFDKRDWSIVNSPIVLNRYANVVKNMGDKLIFVGTRIDEYDIF